MIRRTGLAPWEFVFPFAGSLTSTFLVVGGDGHGEVEDLLEGFRLLLERALLTETKVESGDVSKQKWNLC